MFTESKTKVRELNYRAIMSCLNIKLPQKEYSYFGLPSPEMEDIFVWRNILCSVAAMERGTRGREWKWQHELAKNAMVWGIPGFSLLRGDIDDAILDGHDEAGQKIHWPFDIINLDYTGGIIYKETGRKSKRIEALKQLIERQGRAGYSFFLTITVNDRHADGGEIGLVLDEVLEKAKKFDSSATQVISHLKKTRDKRKLAFVYTCHVILGVAQLWFRTGVFKPIFYIGRGDYRMLNMSFCFKHLGGRSAPIGSSSAITEALNTPEINLEVGKPAQTRSR